MTLLPTELEIDIILIELVGRPNRVKILRGSKLHSFVEASTLKAAR